MCYYSSSTYYLAETEIRLSKYGVSFKIQTNFNHHLVSIPCSYQTHMFTTPLHLIAHYLFRVFFSLTGWFLSYFAWLGSSVTDHRYRSESLPQTHWQSLEKNSVKLGLSSRKSFGFPLHLIEVWASLLSYICGTSTFAEFLTSWACRWAYIYCILNYKTNYMICNFL